MNNSSSLFDLIMVLLTFCVLLFCSIFFKILVIMVYLSYLYFHKNNLLVYTITFLKGICILIILFLVLILFNISFLDSFFIIITVNILIVGLYLFCIRYSSMEILFAFTCLLTPLDFIGVNANKLSWKLTRSLRNIKIYYRTFKNSVKDKNGSGINFKNSSIYDKINNSKQKINAINKIAKSKILQLDQMMHLRLFDVDYYRTNYYAKDVKISDFVFMLLLFTLLISEVIL